jgi:hypothetical protein
MTLRLETIAMETVMVHLPQHVQRLPNSIIRKMPLLYFTNIFKKKGERAMQLAQILLLYPEFDARRAELKKIMAMLRIFTPEFDIMMDWKKEDEGEVEDEEEVEDEDNEVKEEVKDVSLGIIWGVSDFKEVGDANTFQEFLTFLEYLVVRFFDASFILPKHPNDQLLNDEKVEYQIIRIKQAVMKHI